MRLLLFLAIAVQIVTCARILGIFFVPAYSHFVLGETLFKELAERGHDVTVVSSYPQKEKVKNYRDIPITELNDIFEKMRNEGTLFDNLDKSAIRNMFNVFTMGVPLTELSLQNKNVQNLLNSPNETFDLIILEQFLNEAHFGFMHRFKVPLILVGTTAASLWSNRVMSNPTPFSYIPNFLLGSAPKMNLWERAYNTFLSTYQNLLFYGYVLPKHNEILHKYFPDAPHIRDLMYNASLFFVNSHPAIGAAVPLQPNMIEIGGFHVQNDKQSLSGDLKKFLDEAKEGVVYFSLGSNLRSKALPKEKVKGILLAFAKLKMKVLWKWEDDKLFGKPDNVKIQKWLPQPAVLAHENVKVFITHGGRLSIIESIYFGKPIIGIPVFGDQHCNIQEAVHFGYGLSVLYHDLDERHLSDALAEIIKNPKYAENAKFRSDALKGLNVSPLENAISWIEYVVKYKGAPHLKNAGIDLSWYQYLLLDVALLYIIVVWTLKIVLCKVIFQLFKRLKVKKEKLKHR